MQIIISILTAFVEILFFGGVIFGYSFLQYVLEKEGYFGYLCNNNDTPSSFNATSTNNVATTCNKQEGSFNLVFTLGSSFLYFAAFPSGYLLDRFGTWIFRTVITTFYTLAYILLAASTPSMSNLLYPSMILFGITGLGLLMSNYQLANLASSVRGSLLTFMNGLFSSSVVVFLSVKKSYDAGISLYLMLTIMTCLTVFLWLRTYLVLPQKSIPFPLPSEEVQYGWKEISCEKKSKKLKIDSSTISPMMGSEENDKCECTKDVSPKSKTKFAESLSDVLFWTNAFHYSVIALRLSFVFSSFLSWLKSFANPEDISKLTNDFGVILLFGVCISPINGIIIDTVRKLFKSRTKSEKVLNLKASFVSSLITSILGIFFSIMVLISSTYGTFIFLLLCRGFVHGGNTTFIVLNFPFYHFGKLFGLVSFCAGCISLIQYALFQVFLHHDPTFLYINIGFLVATLLTLVHPIAIFVKINVLK